MNSPTALPLPSPTPGPQNRLLFRIYLLYRTVLSVVFLLLLALPATRELVGFQARILYGATSILFLLSNLVVLGAAATRWQDSNLRLVLLFSVDIVCITLLSHASGGMSSGLPLLLTITVASSAVLITKRSVATLVAALSVLAILSDALWLMTLNAADIKILFPAGLLGLLFFVVSGIMQLIVLRLGSVEAIASERASDIYRLQRLNEQIVQQMQAGLMLVDGAGHTRLMNAAASRLLDPGRPPILEQGRPVSDYSEDLARRLQRFQRDGQQSGSPCRRAVDGAEILTRFVSIDAEGEGQGQVLVVLEDYAPVVAQAQALKLSSLGRLAGSIAHEIRNPLGAISHAAQLLQESPHISPDDHRILDMVLTNSQRVNEIVESVLQVSRREPPRPERLVLTDWLPAYRARYRVARGDSASLTIEFVDPRAIVQFDPEHLQRILDNLADNGMRYSQEKTGVARAELRVRVDEQRGECIIEMHDDGAGVSPADIPRLFEPFFTRSRQGSGLGLYLCRELCEINEARITYAPTTDGHSRFQISAALTA